MVKRPKPKDPLTLSPRQAAELTGLGMNACYALLKNGEMPSIKSGKKYFIPKSALLKWLENCGGNKLTA
jgi:excisionase family DNA binding protein